MLNLDEEIYLHGYWQAEEYFKDNKDPLHLCTSMSLHIRRGDYLTGSSAAGCLIVADSRKISETLQSLLEDRGLRGRMGQSALQVSETHTGGAPMNVSEIFNLKGMAIKCLHRSS